MKTSGTALYPLSVRVWHWIHAAAVLILLFTGMQIRFTENISLMPFKAAVETHILVGWVLLVDYLLWFIYQIATGRISQYRFTAKEFMNGGLKQAAFYLYGLFQGRANPFVPTPQNPLNPLQKITYLIFMFFCLPVQIISGILLWRGTQSERIIELATGLKTADGVHVILFFLITGFLIGHIYLGTTGRTPFSDYRAMIKGDETRSAGT